MNLSTFKDETYRKAKPKDKNNHQEEGEIEGERIVEGET